MSAQKRNVLKNWFRKGLTPTQDQFADLFDSFFHKSEDLIPLNNVEGLSAAVETKKIELQDYLNSKWSEFINDIGGYISGILDPAVEDLRESVSSEEGRAMAAEGQIAARIGAVEAAEQVLDSKIGAEEMRAKSAEQQNAARIGAVEDAEQVLDSKIGAEETRARTAEQQNASNISAIEALMPVQASASNQLADKDFVNSSIATNTANYVSDGGHPFASLQALNAYSGPVTANDYAFVVGTDAQGNTTYTRYKFVSSSWAEEYVLNNSSFTAAQWAAIESGITAALVGKLAALPTNSELISRFNEKQAVLVSGSNIKSINGKSVLGSGNLEIKDILLVLYNSTSYNDIAQAYISGKIVFSLDLPNGRLYTLTSITNDGATFTSFDCDRHSFYSFVVNSSNVYSAVATTPIQVELSFDSAPTENSSNPVTSDGIKRAEDELLLRAQGKSVHYNGDTDPVLRRSFPEDAPEGVDRYKYAIKQANDFLNGEYFAINDGKHYRGQENGVPREIDVQELRSICQNIVHIDITGGCVWVMNMPLSFATGSFRQIAFGAEPYSSTDAGYEVTNGIRCGGQVLQRLSSYDWSTGVVTWSEWKEVISDLDSIRTAASGALQKSGGQMTGDINLGDHSLFVRANRRGIQFAGSGNYQGVYVGNGNMRLFLETDPNLSAMHKKGNNYYALFDEGNTVYEVTSDIFNGVVNSQMTVPQALVDAVNGQHSGHMPIYLSWNGIMSHCDVFNDGTANGLIWHINNASKYVAVKGVITNTTLTIYSRKEIFDWNL